jgi:hypothetical protein
MAVDTPSDGQIPAYQSSSGEFEWVDDSAGGSPGGSNNEIQFNNSGAFDGDAGLLMSVKGDGNTTKIQVGNLKVGAAIVETASTNGFVTIACDGTGQIFLQSGNGAGGTWTDSVVNIMCNANTNNAQLKFRDNGNTDNGSITLDSSGDMVLNNNVANKDIDLKILGTGQVEIANQTTNNDTTLSVKGNGTGDAKINLNNPSKAVTLICDTNQKLKVQGGVNSFVFDASSGTGGITFPDGTTQTTAASGGISGLTGLVENNSIWLGNDPSSSTSTAQKNVAVGSEALAYVTTADEVTAIGYGAGSNTTTSGGGQTYIGYRAGFSNTTAGAGGNTFVGSDAGRGVNNASYCTFIGADSGDNASGFMETSTAVGYFSHFYRGSFNAVLGGSALQNSSSSNNSNCVAIGYESLKNCTGDDNIGVGSGAGKNSVSGTGNVMIGKNAYVTTVSGNNQLAIAGGDAAIYWIKGDSSGSCFQGDNASTWSTTSDERLKREIVDSPDTLDKINQIRIRNFRFIEPANPIYEEKTIIEEDDSENTFDELVGWDGENQYGLDPEPTRIGVIAQELQSVFPEAVTENSNGHLSVNPDSIHWALIKAVQELTAKVEELEAQLG